MPEADCKDALKALLKALGPSWSMVVAGYLAVPENPGRPSPVFALRHGAFDVFCYGTTADRLLADFVRTLSDEPYGRLEFWWRIPDRLRSVSSAEELRLRLAVTGENPPETEV